MPHPASALEGELQTEDCLWKPFARSFAPIIRVFMPTDSLGFYYCLSCDLIGFDSN